MLHELLVVLFLIGINAFFSLSEIAVVSSRRSRLQELLDSGNKGAGIALHLSESPSSFLAFIQIGVTLVGIIAGAYSGHSISQKLTAWLQVKIPSLTTFAEPLSFVFSVLFIGTITLVYGELVPKRLALSQPEQFAASFSRPLYFLSRIFFPVTKLLSLVTESSLKLLGAKTMSDNPVTEEEVKILIEQGTEAGVFEKHEETMMKRVLRLNDLCASDLMTPRVKVVALDLSDSVEQNLKKIHESPHTYFPVCDDNPDNLVGIISIKDLLRFGDIKSNTEIRQLCFFPFLFPESMVATKVLEKFKESGKHVGIVVDEFGGFAGFITIIDVMEAIVGFIPELEKGESPGVVMRDDGSYLIDGTISIVECFDILKIDYTETRFDDFQTLGGLCMNQLGKIPKEGDKFELDNFIFEVIDMDGHRVDKLLVSKVEEDG